MKKAISIIITMTMLVTLVLTGCGEKKQNVTDTFKIGGIGPLTGSNAFYGQEVKNGMMLAVDEINEAGGICGKQVEMNYQDDESEPQKVIEAYNELMEWGMHTVVGAVTSDSCIVLAAETSRDNIFQVTPSSSAMESVIQYNVFQICFSDTNQGAAAAEYIYKEELGKRVAVIYDISSTYSTGIFRGFSEKADEMGLELVSINGFNQKNNEDFSAMLKEIKETKADLIFLPIYYQEASLILTQAQLLDMDIQYFGCDGIEGVLEVEGFEKTLAEGLMYLTPYVLNEMSADAIAFREKYEAVYGTSPSQFAADAYDAVHIIKMVAEEAGITVDMSAEEMCDAMVGAMKVISYEGITSLEGTYMRWNEDGMVEKEPKVAIIENGEYKIR